MIGQAHATTKQVRLCLTIEDNAARQSIQLSKNHKSMDKTEKVMVFVNATSGRLMSMVFSYYHLRQARSFDGARDALESRFLNRE